MAIRLRPHHVLCSLGFEGKGYNDAFTANMAHIVLGQLRAVGGEDVSVHITGQADSICAPCPLRRGVGCENQAKIDRLDLRHGRALGISPGDRLQWKDCLEKVSENVTPDDLDYLCEGCTWLEHGMCKTALTLFLAERGLAVTKAQDGPKKRVGT